MKNDVTFVVILIAFFALSVLFVRACDWLIGSDEAALGELADHATEAEPETRAA
jgi:hypothetical protein